MLLGCELRDGVGKRGLFLPTVSLFLPQHLIFSFPPPRFPREPLSLKSHSADLTGRLPKFNEPPLQG